MADPKVDKKKIEAAKKAVQAEVKKLGGKLKKPAKVGALLLDKKKELEGVPSPDPSQKKQLKEIDLKIGTLQKYYLKEAMSSSKRLDAMLKNYVPDDKKAVKSWQKGMAKWYVDILNKEPGFDIGHGLRLNGEISFTKKKVFFSLSGKF